MMMRRRWVLCLCGGFLISPIARAADPTVPDEGMIEDAWFMVQLQGQHCGHMHSVMQRVGDEIRTQTTMNLEIARDKARIKIAMQQAYRETLKGEAIAFRQEQTLGEIPAIVTGEIKAGKLKLVESQAGTKMEHEYPWDPEARFAWGQLLAQREHGDKPGTKFTLKTYEPSIRPDGPVETQIAIGDKGDVDVLGEKRRLTMVISTLKLGGAKGAAAAALPIEVSSKSWVDDDGNPVVTSVDVGPMKVMMFKSTREKAVATGAPAEMFLQTFVQAKGAVDDAARVVKYRLRLPADAKMTLPDLPNTEMQTFKRLSDREAMLTVKRFDWDALRSIQEDEKPGADLADYLRASATLDIKAAKIKRLSRQAVRGQSTPAERADALRRFVTDYITDKNLSVGFATATEVARNRRGDCTEHGVLLAALARAAGMPARGVSGLINVPGGTKGKSVFGYHMWSQVYFGGKWVDLDAAMRQTDCAATHIAIAIMPLNEEGMIDSVRALLPLMGRLEIDIEESK